MSNYVLTIKQLATLRAIADGTLIYNREFRRHGQRELQLKVGREDMTRQVRELMHGRKQRPQMIQWKKAGITIELTAEGAAAVERLKAKIIDAA